MNKKGFMTAAILLILCLVFFGCENDPGDEGGSGGGGNQLTISTGSVDVSKFVGWEWSKYDPKNTALDFTWIFKTDGTISVLHCCGLEFPKSFSYLLQDNVLVTYGYEMDIPDKLEIFTFTMTDNGLSFTLSNGISFTRGDRISFATDLKLSNVLLGNWRGNDGKDYVFNANAGLLIGSAQYSYLVRENAYRKELVIMDPPVNGAQGVVLRTYAFSLKDNQLTLTGIPGNQKIILDRK